MILKVNTGNEDFCFVKHVTPFLGIVHRKDMYSYSEIPTALYFALVSWCLFLQSQKASLRCYNFIS